MIGAIKDILGVVNKFIPDKDTQAELEKELKKLEVEDYANKKGSILEKCVSLVFPAIALMFCLLILSNILIGWICFFRGIPAPFFTIDDRMYQIMIAYIAGFFGNRSVKAWKETK